VLPRSGLTVQGALIAAGLLRYGFVAEAQRIATALLEAVECSGGRLPELF
jgi:hypothetical protein